MYKLDFSNFFRCIKFNEFEEKYRDASNKSSSEYEMILNDIKNFCFIVGEDLVRFLPIGFSTSPNIANIYMMKFDELIGKYCNTKGITYTRYSDDCTFSSKYYFDFKELKEKVEYVLDTYYKSALLLNSEKEKFIDSDMNKFVTGVIISEKRLKVSNKNTRDTFNMMLLLYTIIYDLFKIRINDFYKFDDEKLMYKIIANLKGNNYVRRVIKEKREQGILNADVFRLSQNETYDEYKASRGDININQIQFDIEHFKGKLNYFLSINEYSFNVYKSVQLYNQLIYGINRKFPNLDKISHKKSLIFKKNMKVCNAYECKVNNYEYGMLLFFEIKGQRKYLLILPAHLSELANIKNVDIQYEYIVKKQNFICIDKIKSGSIITKDLTYITGYFDQFPQFFLGQEYAPISFLNVEELLNNRIDFTHICNDKFKYNKHMLDILNLIDFEEIWCQVNKR